MTWHLRYVHGYRIVMPVVRFYEGIGIMSHMVLDFNPRAIAHEHAHLSIIPEQYSGDETYGIKRANILMPETLTKSQELVYIYDDDIVTCAPYHFVYLPKSDQPGRCMIDEQRIVVPLVRSHRQLVFGYAYISAFQDDELTQSNALMF